MALIRCYECGKEISSSAAACPSCGAPIGSTAGPPPLPTQSRRVSLAKQVFSGTIALLTGVVLVLMIRGVIQQPNTPSMAASPTPAISEVARSTSPPIQEASKSSPTFSTAETPIAEADTKNSPRVQAVAEGSPPSAAEAPIADSASTNSRSIQTASEPSPTVAETRDVSEAPVAIATSPRATYRVIGIPLGDYLNVRDEAGSDHHVITRLEPGTGGILLGTKRIASGATTWQEITIRGQTGWVNAAYIALESQSPTSPTESSTAP